jgi:hypothetical protein
MAATSAKQNIRIGTYLWICLLVFLAVIGIRTILYITSLGAGVSPDSAVYMGVADSLREGYGFYIPFTPDRLANPMTNFPPLFPSLLALAGIAAGTSMDAGRWLNAFSFGALIFLVGFLLFRVTRGSYAASILGAILVASAKPDLYIHVWIWTEPIFILTGLTGLFVLSIYLDKSNAKYLVIASVFISLAFLLRYSGAAFVLVLLLGILLYKRGKIAGRIYAVAIALAIAILPMLFWMARNQRISGNATSRLLVYHPITMDALNQGFQTILKWLAPSNDPTLKLVLFPLVAFLVLISAVVYFWQKSRFRKDNLSDMNGRFGVDYLVLVLLLFLIIYPIFLIFSISFFDAYTPLDERIFSPEFIPALILAIWIINAAVQSLKKPRPLNLSIRAVLIAIALYISFGWIMEAIAFSNMNHITGFDVNGAARDSRIALALKFMAPDTLIYSNAPDIIYPLTKMHSWWFPWKGSLSSTLQNADYLNNMKQMGDQLRQAGGVLVFFYTVERPYLPTEDELNQMLPLKIIFKNDDGVIYGVK